MNVIRLIFKAAMPGSLSFLLASLVCGVVLLYFPRWSRLGRRLLTALIAVYWLMSTPLGSWGLALPLSRRHASIASVDDARGATAVVVLTATTLRFSDQTRSLDIPGSAAAVRALEGARVAHLLDNPMVFVSGGSLTRRPHVEGETIRATLEQLGVPPNRIVLESASTDTHGHTLNMHRVLDSHGVRRFVLVTSAVHLTRAAAAFRLQGYDFVTSAPVADPASEPAYGLWPRLEELSRAQQALSEYFGLIYYRARGWI